MPGGFVAIFRVRANGLKRSGQVRILAWAAAIGIAGCSSTMQAPSSLDQAAHGASWMQPGLAGGTSPLIYVSSWKTSDVYVYLYYTGKQVGKITGLDKPYGQCVDAIGDIYVTNYGDGVVDEYSHGGTSPLGEFATNGSAIGCSVDHNGNLAVTDFATASGAGQVCVFKGGQQTACYSDSPSCYYMWPAGYDDRGNLFVEGENSKGTRISVCALLKGATSMTALPFKGTINAPGAVVWDGKYVTLDDQRSNAHYDTALYQTRFNGSALTLVGKTVLKRACQGTASNVVQPFIVGATNSRINKKEGRVVIGADQGCVNFWHYPTGGASYNRFTRHAQLYGISVSLAP